jgi:hypothetical protein
VILPTNPSLAQLINMKELMDRVDNDLDFLQDLFHLFKVEFPRLQIELQESVKVKNMHQTAKTAHMLRGMLANLSAECAATAVEVIEQMATKEDQRGAENALIVFNGEVVSLLPCVNAYLAEARHLVNRLDS